MPELAYIHVGPHKTGSTALQHAFATQAKTLERYGIHYPIACRKGAAHQYAAWACRDRHLETLRPLAEEVLDYPNVLISSEIIAGLDEEGLYLLRETLSCKSVQIIYMLRRCPTLWVSHWKELIKFGQALDFQEYLDVIGKPEELPHTTPPLPSQQIATLIKVFGPASMRLLTFEARASSAENYGPDFVDDIFGIGQDAELFTTAPTNLSAEPWQSELVRQVNILTVKKLTHQQRSALRKLVLDTVDRDPPNWLPDFVACYDQLDPMLISEKTTIALQEHSKIIQQYGNLMVDPLEHFTKPVSVEVRYFEQGGLPDPLQSSVTEFFQNL